MNHDDDDFTPENLNMSRARSAVIRATGNLDRLLHRIALITDPDAINKPSLITNTPTLYSAKVELERLLTETLQAQKIIDGADTGTMADITRLCHKLGISL